jgi:hypothetical protein
MNVSISNTQGDEGIIGRIPEPSWLPALPNGATLGPRPESLHERYLALYQTFADAWRVTDETSLFVYAPGTSTATFTDRDWPAEKPPCELKPQFEIPGAPVPVSIGIDEAEQICQAVTVEDLHRDCVFDVATTGDEVHAKGYLIAQDLRLRGSTVQIVGDKPRTRHGEPLVLTATVLPMSSGRPTPTGHVTFFVDGVAAGPPIGLDDVGRASFTTQQLEPATHALRASYTPDGDGSGYRSSSSPNLLHMVEEAARPPSGPRISSWPWWLWVVLILLLILLAIVLYSYLA